MPPDHFETSEANLVTLQINKFIQTCQALVIYTQGYSPEPMSLDQMGPWDKIGKPCKLHNPNSLAIRHESWSVLHALEAEDVEG